MRTVSSFLLLGSCSAYFSTSGWSMWRASVALLARIRRSEYDQWVEHQFKNKMSFSIYYIHREFLVLCCDLQRAQQSICMPKSVICAKRHISRCACVRECYRAHNQHPAAPLTNEKPRQCAGSCSVCMGTATIDTSSAGIVSSEWHHDTIQLGR